MKCERKPSQLVAKVLDDQKKDKKRTSVEKPEIIGGEKTGPTIFPSLVASLKMIKDIKGPNETRR